MNTITELPKFEKSLVQDIDGFFQCPSCKFESKETWDIICHFEMEHED